MRRSYLLAGALLALPLLMTHPTLAQAPGKQEPQTLSRDVTKHVELHYLLSLPKEYGQDKEKRWPLLLFL
ncbi:MAG TPA: hypothetical protein VFU47_11015, partial [Armatimonadota bacterium]|nr:hypothetical protein [Armatimonadota bacterium]